MDAKQLVESNIIDLLGLSNLPEEKKTALTNKMAEVLESRISERVLGELSETDQKNFDTLLQANPSSEKIQEWLTAHVPNFNEITAEEALKFKKQMV
ncbi:MAG: DUF5663 domain-containing protein, partial [bacterium]|nr:DUF5663 domain-containing protein [bacterium]